jgi:site-specific recombinase XerD
MTQAGWTKEQVQQLMGHSDVAMTTLYLDGHELPWSEVRPGLTLTR